MNLIQHLAQQEAAILDGIQQAAKAGLPPMQMGHLYEMLKTTLEAIAIEDEVREHPVMPVIALGYLSAFGDPDDEEKWRYHVERAYGALLALTTELDGFSYTLRSIMEQFDRMRLNAREAARIFGFALTRMHPETLFLAEAASAQG